jgi:uncharacterized membrane protein
MRKNFFLKFSYLVMIIFSAGFFLSAGRCSARENVTDWYIKNFDSKIIVNKDSSLDITETILADCGNAPDKHGIFRIVPEKINIAGKGAVKTPVKLLSITDAAGKPYAYSESENSSAGTITWKIGEAGKTVRGENVYVIRYQVQNAIRFWNDGFDELYWNLTGNFWELEMDNAHVEVVFPKEVDRGNRTVDVYSGSLGEKGNELASFGWIDGNVLEVDSVRTLGIGQGITASVTFPKNIFTPYQPSFWESYGFFVFLLIPIMVFFTCLNLWFKYGKDPKMDKTVIAEYDAPERMSPIEVGMLMTNGALKNTFITAEIVNLATKDILTIKEVDNQILFFHSKDYEFTRRRNVDAENSLNAPQKAILDELFGSGDTISLSSLKNSFYKILNDVKEKGKRMLLDKKMITASGLSFSMGFLVGGIMLAFGGLFLIGVSGGLAFSIILSGLIMALFGAVMPKRTEEGAEANRKIKGFKLFMETVDKDRARFYEEENIFEKFLPYAIVFGITGLWVKKMKEIYGEDYYATHAPLWYVGNVAAFDADSFASEMDSLSSSISANTSSPSGSGGSGGSGGGGGGGGGGGW